MAGRLPSPDVTEDARGDGHPAAVRVGIVLLTGPSGSGKSVLAARSGLPTVGLDDFYRDGDEDDLPRDPAGRIDWDDVGSWDADAALAALQALATTGRTQLPIYDIASDRAVGTRHLDIGDAPLVIAEGIFAAELIGPCRARGLLADALCLANGRNRTFRRRLARDLRESRKAPWTLVRRGWQLRRSEPELIAGLRSRGARIVDAETALARLRTLGAPVVGRRDAAA